MCYKLYTHHRINIIHRLTCKIVNPWLFIASMISSAYSTASGLMIASVFSTVTAGGSGKIGLSSMTGTTTNRTRLPVHYLVHVRLLGFDDVARQQHVSAIIMVGDRKIKILSRAANIILSRRGCGHLVSILICPVISDWSLLLLSSHHSHWRLTFFNSCLQVVNIDNRPNRRELIELTDYSATKQHPSKEKGFRWTRVVIFDYR